MVCVAYGFLLADALKFSIALLVIGWLIITVSIYRHNFFESKAKRVRVAGQTLISITLAVILVVLWFALRPSPPADVTLRFISPPIPPVLEVVRKNESGGIAKEMRYKVVIWNLDALKASRGWPGGLPPLCSFHRGELGGWLRKGEESDPEWVFEACPKFYHALVEGDRLLGFAFITCADCAHSHGYWLYKVWGQPGWFAETADGSDPEKEFSKEFSRGGIIEIARDPEKYLNTLHLRERKPMATSLR